MSSRRAAEAKRYASSFNRMTLNSKVKSVVPVLGALLLSGSLVIAQNQPATPDFRGLPDRPALVDRIQQFVEAQREQDWSRVSALLDPFRDNAYRKRYTNDHKQCLIEQMKSGPMLTFAPIGGGYSTEILSRPLSQKWWYIRGVAEFGKDGRKLKRETTIIAYRFEGQWFFTPPNYDGAIACFSRSLVAIILNADRAPQLKATVGPLVEW